MSDPDPDDPPAPAASPPARSIEASRRLSQLLARPLGTPAPPGETPEPYVPRSPRTAPPPAPAPEPDDTASVSEPPPEAAAEPDLPWFERPAPPEAVAAPEPFEAEPAPAARSTEVAAHDEPRAPAPEHDDDLFDRRDPFPLHAPAAPNDEAGWRETPSDVADHEALPRASDQVPDWAWPSALDRPTEAAPASDERDEPPEPHRVREPLRPAPREAAASEPAAAPTPAPRPLDPDAARALGNIRRLMLVSNLFMVVAIGAVLAVVGYRLFRTEPAAPPAPAPTPPAKPVLATIPNDMTLTLPRGARIVETAVAGDRLVITIEIDGATEIRTFDVKTLQPIGRLSFATVP